MNKPLITLFTPGNRPDLIAKSPRSNPDAVIIDLEDAVPIVLKKTTRREVGELVPRLTIPTIVRVNSESGLIDLDLEAIVSRHLSGILLPMADTVALVQKVDRTITRLERERGLEPNSVKLFLSLETALGVHRCFDLVTAAKRVESAVVGTAEDGDLQHDLKCNWSSTGPELLYARGKVLLECRAAGLPYVLDGAYSGIQDLNGLRADCVISKRIGFDGRTLIHPSHVAVAREIYIRSAAEKAFYKRMVKAFEEAETKGRAAIQFEGKLVDYAMYKKAKLVAAE